MNDIIKKIAELEAEIVELPVGYISRKTIGGKVRLYHQWSENGRKKSKYLDDAAAEEMSVLIEKRRQLEQELKELKKQLPKENVMRTLPVKELRISMLLGDELRSFAEPVREYKRRSCFDTLQRYLYDAPFGKVFILYGLRRTGKTTLIRQSLLDMSDDELAKTAFIQTRPGDTLGDLDAALKQLSRNGYKRVFIDEVTLAEDFIEGAALFSDIYAASGMKIVLSGKDSLGFMFSENEELYDRCVMLHTTRIPYKEFEQVLGIKGIDEYIRYGGTMSLGGKHYNQPETFSSKKSTDEYIDTAIAKNIQHSLKYYQNGGHFRHLAELYEKDELTSAINRVVEDINHRFTVEVLTRDFISHDLGISRTNLRKDRTDPTDILDRIDKDTFTEGLRRTLDILNKKEQTIDITEAHRREIKEYLDLLDLTVDIPTEVIPVKNEKLYRTAISQPGMRYAQAEALVKQLLLDEDFRNISAVDRAKILERILSEIRGRMMEEIVLLETKTAYPDKEVFRLQFAVGEFDMVIADAQAITCEIYEIKHSTEAVPAQYRHLADKQKCADTEFRFGRITKKAVIYRGENYTENGIDFLNVESYLKGLPV